MNSCLYECDVMHYRKKPKTYRFTNKLFMFYIDLDEVDELDRSHYLFAHNRRSVFEFRDADHMSFSHQTLKENVQHFVKSKGVKETIHRVMLMTNCRTLGYQFNSVSFYFCFDKDDQPVCAVPEIGNTFGELKPYCIGTEHFQKDRFEDVQTKYFYISPFVAMDIPMEFQLSIPAESLHFRIDDWNKERTEKFLLTTMRGQRKPLTTKNLWYYGLKFPLVTLRMIAMIHWHAGILHFIKKIPYFKKSEDKHLQKEVQREHKD